MKEKKKKEKVRFVKGWGEVDDGAIQAEMNLRSWPGHIQIGESRKAPTPFDSTEYDRHNNIYSTR